MFTVFLAVKFASFQDELEEIAAAHEAGLADVDNDDDDELCEEARKMKEEARMREDMADMGFD